MPLSQPPSDPLDPICFRCSKPIRSETGIPMGGGRIHVRCLAEDTRLESVEQQDRASREIARAKELVELARLCSAVEDIESLLTSLRHSPTDAPSPA
jgi:hypothetical protein